MIVYDIIKKREIFQGFKFYVSWSNRGHWFAHCNHKEKLTQESEGIGETPKEALNNLIAEMKQRKRLQEKKLAELTKIIDDMEKQIENVDELRDRQPVDHEEYLKKFVFVAKIFE